jgi:hypothetical protein
MYTMQSINYPDGVDAERMLINRNGGAGEAVYSKKLQWRVHRRQL